MTTSIPATSIPATSDVRESDRWELVLRGSGLFGFSWFGFSWLGSENGEVSADPWRPEWGRIRPSASNSFLAVAQFDLVTIFIDSLPEDVMSCPEDVLKLKGGTVVSMMVSDSQQRNARFLTDPLCSPILRRGTCREIIRGNFGT
jgi:hypothetical protein